jgi:hypothetical protein
MSYLFTSALFMRSLCSPAGNRPVLSASTKRRFPAPPPPLTSRRLLPHVQQRIDRRIAARRERARPFYEAHPDRAPDWFKAESRVIPLVRRPRPDLPPTAMSHQFSPFLNGAAVVLPLQRVVMISSEA